MTEKSSWSIWKPFQPSTLFCIQLHSRDLFYRRSVNKTQFYYLMKELNLHTSVVEHIFIARITPRLCEFNWNLFDYFGSIFNQWLSPGEKMHRINKGDSQNKEKSISRLNCARTTKNCLHLKGVHPLECLKKHRKFERIWKFAFPKLLDSYRDQFIILILINDRISSIIITHEGETDSNWQVITI